MKEIRSFFEHTGIQLQEMAPLKERLAPEIGRITAAWGVGYDTDYASLTFLTVANQEDISVPRDTAFDSLVPMIQGSTFNTIMKAIVQGTQKAYVHANRPFMTIELPEISAYYCGQLLQMKMVEIMYLGFLFDINPFNQPQVEWYKKETRKILSHE